MNEYEYVKFASELAKIGIEDNVTFSEWEKWWRKTGVEMTMQYARKYYSSKMITEDNQNKN